MRSSMLKGLPLLPTLRCYSPAETLKEKALLCQSSVFSMIIVAPRKWGREMQGESADSSLYIHMNHQDEDHKDHFIANPQLIYLTLLPIITTLFLSSSCINMLG